MADSTSFRELLTRFGTTAQCLAHLARLRWPNGIHCEKCERVTKHHLRAERKCYACQHCGNHVHPTVGTIFHNSKVPLPDWFYVIWQFAKTRAGFSAKQIEREIGVSYPTALRMCNLIRSQMGEDGALWGFVEADETYIGGQPRIKGVSRRGRGTKKVPVLGAVERSGKVVTRVVDRVKREELMSFLTERVERGSTIYTDELNLYAPLTALGYTHDTVQHRTKEYSRLNERGDRVHTNNLEGFWSYPKSAVLHVHRGVSRKYLQGYLDEHAFRRNHRDAEGGLFFALLSRVASPEPRALAA